MDAHRQTPASDTRARPDISAMVRRFDAPDRVVTVDQGRLEVITVGALVIGRGSYAPGWRWSQTAHVPSDGERAPDHVGVVLSGRAKVVIEGSEEIDLTPGDFFHIATEFDGWVVGQRPCEILYIKGVEHLIERLDREGKPVG